MMSEDDNFLARWSRRKRGLIADTPARPNPKKDSAAVASDVPGDRVPSGETELFDPESLPPIESIGPGSDVRAFLAAGVPADLTRAALRRLWSSDPKIRDFIGLSENSWDFNAPGAMAGFGPIDKEQVDRVLTQLLGDSNAERVASHSIDAHRQAGEAEIGPNDCDRQESADSTAALEEQLPAPAAATNDLTRRPNVAPMLQVASTSADHRAPRRRGGALPD